MQRLTLLHNAYVIQGIGFLAFGLGISAFLSSKDIRLKQLLSAQGATLAVHFTLLGARAGTAIVTISALRNLLSIQGNLKPFAVIFMALYVSFGLASAHHWFDVLPVIAELLATYALFYLHRLQMRLYLLMGTLLWLTHNVAVGSIGPSIMEALIFGINIRTILRLRRQAAAAPKPIAVTSSRK